MGTLYLVSTPIGNLEDITVRAIRLLLTIPVIACEDTRKTGLLINRLRETYKRIIPETNAQNIRFIIYNNETEAGETPGIITLLENGQSVAIVTDAGTPMISDPGYLAVRESLRRGIPVVSVPGPSSVLTALLSSGLPADAFLFLGYTPEKQSHRLKLLASVEENNQKIAATTVIFCAPHKLQQTLKDILTVLGDIHIVLARELTKSYEEIWRGSVRDAQHYFAEPKGEFVLLFRL